MESQLRNIPPQLLRRHPNHDVSRSPLTLETRGYVKILHISFAIITDSHLKHEFLTYEIALGITLFSTRSMPPSSRGTCGSKRNTGTKSPSGSKNSWS